MRRPELLVFAVCIGLIGIVAWQGRAWLGQTLHATSAVTVDPAIDKRVNPAHSGVAKHSAVTKQSPGRTASGPAVVTSESSEISVPAELNLGTTVVTRLPDVPDSENMEIGAPSAELRKRYGAPTLAVESVSDGSLVERYYYVKPDRNNLVIATLREGKLVSATTARVWQPQPRRAAP